MVCYKDIAGIWKSEKKGKYKILKKHFVYSKIVNSNINTYYIYDILFINIFIFALISS